ncbi:MAG: DNA polymerase I [Patescibacteria group bacterium]
MPAKKQKLLIIDGNALIHRSFHALPATMKTKTGEITNAVYGFTMVLLKALKEFKPEYIVLTLDRKEKTFRHEEYTEYKAKRVKAPDELYAQIPRVKDIATAFNIPIFERAGFEADDLIGTIATKIRNQKSEIRNNIESIIVTGDMDTLQLVNEHTKVYTMSHGLSDSLLYDAKQVEQRFNGLKPEQMIDYKALRGDPSDNIPGVPGIGEKGAIDLLLEFGSLENLYAQLDKPAAAKKIKPRTLELLKDHKDKALLSKKLATIICDVPLDFDLAKAKTRDFDMNEVVRVFNELEFRSLLPRLQELNKKLQPVNKTSNDEQNKFTFVQTNFDYQIIDDETKFKKFLAELKKQKEFAFDTETANFNSLAAELLGISFSWKEGEAYYVQMQNVECRMQNENKQKSLFGNDGKLEKKVTSDNSKGIATNYVIEKLKYIFADAKIKKICHNAKFDVEVMESNSLKVEGIYFDTMIASYLLNPGTRQHSLDTASFNYLNYQKISKEDLLGTGRNKISFGEVPVERLGLYSCEDADFTFRLYQKLAPELKKKKLDKLFHEIEMPLVRVLVEMEKAGIKLDLPYLADLEKNFSQELKKLEREIQKLAGKPFNVNSPKQLQEILFEKLNIPTHLIKRTKTGYSTGADELYKLKGQHEIIDLIVRHRELAKLQNTYIEALPKLADKTGRVHTSFNQTITATGRLSSSEPNLQNIPTRTDEGKKIRRAFIARRGYKLISADYSQIELRLAASMANDTKMIAAFKRGDDIHTATAAAINEIPLDKVTPAMRREAKATNFGIIYGQGAFGLSQTADIPQWRAKEFIDKYFATYPGVKKYIDECIKTAQKTGYAETLFGRTRQLPEINSSTIQIRKAAERTAINTPLQGTAADIMKIAMIDVQDALAKFGEDIKVLLQVHDELVIEVKTDLVKKIAAIVKTEMEKVIKLKVPIVAEVEVGENWEEMEEVEK